MKAFDTLFAKRQSRLYHQLALNALREYDLDGLSLRLVGQFTNILFRVKTACGVPYLLRICRPGWRTDQDLRSEAMWLQALARESDIGAPEPLAARNGDFMVQADTDGIPEIHRCMLMSWIPMKN